MRLSFAVFILGLTVCLALEDIKLEPLEPNVEDSDDDDFSDEDLASEAEEGPSFEEIKAKMEKQGVLRHPHILGIFRAGEKPHDLKPEPKEDEPALLSHQASHQFRLHKPMCARRSSNNYQLSIGRTAFLVVYNFGCYGRCYWCYGRWNGYCRQQRMRISMHILVERYSNRWYWTWRTLYIPSCCKCHSNRRG